jgi:hypothetical protein
MYWVKRKRQEVEIEECAHKWDATENGTFAAARPAIKYRMFTHMCPSAEKWASVRLGNRDLSTASQRWMSREMGHVLALFYLFRFKNQVTIPKSMGFHLQAKRSWQSIIFGTQ